MKITIIGVGNLGSHLAKTLYLAGLRIEEVFSRKKINADEVAQFVRSKSTNNLSQLSPKANVYLLSVKDTAIEEVAAVMSAVLPDNALVAHTSGATPATVLAKYFKRYGVFYPLQTFSKFQPTDFSRVPMCIHAPIEEDQHVLEWIAHKISPKIYSLDDAQRSVLHVAAVFANNFTNHLFEISKQLLDQSDIPFELLFPIIEETVQKIQIHDPASIQTGPAIRNDEDTLDRHFQYLQTYPELQKIYTLLSKSINPKIKF